MGSFTIAGNARSRGLGRVDPRLVSILQAAAARSPYNVEVFSSVRAGSAKGSRHNSGNALDIVLSTPQGVKIPNLKSSVGFPIYEQFAQTARAIQQEQYPELENSFRWGGYFAGGKDKYGAVDLMHFDIKPGAAMGGGTWENGLTEAQARIVASMGGGFTYSSEGQVRADGKRTFANLWGREPLTADEFQFGTTVDPVTASAVNPAGARDTGFGILESAVPSTPDRYSMAAFGAAGQEPVGSVTAREFGLSSLPDMLSVPSMFGDPNAPRPPASIPTGLTPDQVVSAATRAGVAAAPASASDLARRAGALTAGDVLQAAATEPVQRQALAAPRQAPALGSDFMDRVAEQSQLAAMENAALAGVRAPSMPAMTPQTIQDRVDFASMPRPGVGVTAADVLAAAARQPAPQFSPGIASPTQTVQASAAAANAPAAAPSTTGARGPADQVDRIIASVANAPVPRPNPQAMAAPVPTPRPPPSAPVPQAKPASAPIPTPKPAAPPAAVASVPTPRAAPARAPAVAVPTPPARPAVTPAAMPMNVAPVARPATVAMPYSPSISEAQFNDRFSAAFDPSPVNARPVAPATTKVSVPPVKASPAQATVSSIIADSAAMARSPALPVARQQPVALQPSLPAPVPRERPAPANLHEPGELVTRGGFLDTGIEGKTVGAILGAAAGALTGVGAGVGATVGKAIGGKVTPSTYKAPSMQPRNYVGSGANAVQAMLSGAGRPGDYATARNLPSGVSGYSAGINSRGQPTMQYSMGGRTITTTTIGGTNFTSYS